MSSKQVAEESSLARAAFHLLRSFATRLSRVRWITRSVLVFYLAIVGNNSAVGASHLDIEIGARRSKLVSLSDCRDSIVGIARFLGENRVTLYDAAPLGESSS